MADQARRLAALDALARDRGATEAERRLAAEHAAKLRAVVGTQAETYVAVEVDNVLVEAFDKAMARAMSIRSPRHSAAAVRWIKAKAGPDVVGQWQVSRGKAIGR